MFLRWFLMSDREQFGQVASQSEVEGSLGTSQYVHLFFAISSSGRSMERPCNRRYIKLGCASNISPRIVFISQPSSCRKLTCLQEFPIMTKSLAFFDGVTFLILRAPVLLTVA